MENINHENYELLMRTMKYFHSMYLYFGIRDDYYFLFLGLEKWSSILIMVMYYFAIHCIYNMPYIVCKGIDNTLTK